MIARVSFYTQCYDEKCNYLSSLQVIAKNSPGDTKAKNTGIFWSWFNTSMLVGNVFLYFYLGRKSCDVASTIIILLILAGSGQKEWAPLKTLFFMYI